MKRKTKVLLLILCVISFLLSVCYIIYNIYTIDVRQKAYENCVSNGYYEAIIHLEALKELPKHFIRVVYTISSLISFVLLLKAPTIKEPEPPKSPSLKTNPLYFSASSVKTAKKGRLVKKLNLLWNENEHEIQEPQSSVVKLPSLVEKALNLFIFIVSAAAIILSIIGVFYYIYRTYDSISTFIKLLSIGAYPIDYYLPFRILPAFLSIIAHIIYLLSSSIGLIYIIKKASFYTKKSDG